MSSYFSNFSLDKIASTINTAAHKTQQKLNETQEQLTHAIHSINLDDPQTMLSLRTRKHQLQETLGTIKDISKLPPRYQFLERKCDAFEKVCSRILVVSKTFEVDGYDYPPNLAESISDWWGSSSKKDGVFWGFGKKSKNDKNKAEQKSSAEKKSNEGYIPPSFAQAISKAADDSITILKELNEEQLVNPSNGAETEDEDVDSLMPILEAWAEAQSNIDEAKQQMDQFMINEFNKKLDSLVNNDFLKVRALRKKVEESRLKFDTLRYELEMRKSGASQTKETFTTIESQQVNDKDKENEDNLKPTIHNNTGIGSSSDEEDQKFRLLLEKAEDEFVSNTTDAVAYMTQITDSVNLSTLVKLFHNFQLIYHKKCVQELQASLNVINTLTVEEDGEE
ncbi:uncharacterized protein Ecym_1238 [Eremothecium cymbalariae DBVPG|uniref:Uncharacterized protein n=1 Tax=Eremothecium cymbalariae (strain CBS 270.75 / DBVPG 7215 / KCTC 17166 / NRRL Y-17582) TaxID=931890 RepID=G8JN20_ERECY|nr:hypothetical protein Ecym_1238 [Eremothecium cymbalariae DBVPG\